MKRGSPIHVYPLRDLREHKTGKGQCWCEPRVERGAAADVIVHNSADGRELVERHGVQ